MKMKEAYDNQAKAPKKGVKADDADEYQARDASFEESVEKSKAYAKQSKAPQGRGSRGPSQSDGGPIERWDVPVKAYGAYDAQCHWGEGDNNSSPSLGFKMESGPSDYLGHFKNEKFLRMGHNDGPSLGSMADAWDDKQSAELTNQKNLNVDQPDERSSQDKTKSAQDSMRKAFNYGDDD